MAEYDQKNQELYDKNTDKIQVALDAIRKDKKLKVTKSQVIRLTGLHRNTFDCKGARAWVGVELEIIKKQRQEESKRSQLTKKQQEGNLQDLLDQSKLEILHWFTKYSELERELGKQRIRSKRDIDSLEWHKAEIKKEREVHNMLEERIELLENLLNDKLGNNGA